MAIWPIFVVRDGFLSRTPCGLWAAKRPKTNPPYRGWIEKAENNGETGTKWTGDSSDFDYIPTMNEPKKLKLDIKTFPYSDTLFNNEIPWHQRGGLYGASDESDTLIVGSLNDKNVVYLLCDCASTTRRIFYIQAHPDYQNRGFATSLLEYFLKNFAEGVDVESSPPASSLTKKLLGRYGFIPLDPAWWIKKKE